MMFRQRLLCAVMCGAFLGLQSCGAMRAFVEVLESPDAVQRLSKAMTEDEAKQAALAGALTELSARVKSADSNKDGRIDSNERMQALIGGGTALGAAWLAYRNSQSGKLKAGLAAKVDEMEKRITNGGPAA